MLLLLPLLALLEDASLLAAGAAAASAAATNDPAPNADPAALVAQESPRPSVSRIHPRARVPFMPIPTRAASFSCQVPAPTLNLQQNLGLQHP